MANKNLRRLTRGAVIAALYVVLTELATLVGLSSGVIQFRISEALCVLPAFIPEAIPGLFIGCLLSNLLAGGVIWDILFGSLATLLGAVGAYLLRRYRWLIPIPTVVANAAIVPFVLRYAYGAEGSLWYFALTVGIGEVVCAYILGVLLYGLLNRYRGKLFN